MLISMHDNMDSHLYGLQLMSQQFSSPNTTDNAIMYNGLIVLVITATTAGVIMLL